MIKYMEKEGIGRPSTYSSVLQKLYDRNFVEKANAEGEKKSYTHYVWTAGKMKKETESRAYFSERSKMIPTESGMKASVFLKQEFQDIVNVGYTSEMESALDRVAAGEAQYGTIIGKFCPTFLDRCDKLRSSLPREEMKDSTRRLTPKGVVIRVGRYGPMFEWDSKNYSLKPYLKISGKQLEHVTDKDIELIRSLPKTVRFKNDEYTIAYGRYGFYTCRHKDKRTLTIYAKYLTNLMEREYDFVSKMYSAYHG